MRLLLDTHVLIWWLAGDPSLAACHRDAIADADTDVFVSAASIWEISIKRALRRLVFPLEQIQPIMAQCHFTPLPITFQHAAVAGGLPPHHQDLFDRLLIAQAQTEGLLLASADSALARYDVALLAR